MKLSISSLCYTGGCLVLGVLNGYKNPVLWITTFALGVLAGSWLGNMTASDVLKHQNAITAEQSAKHQQGLESAQAALSAGALPAQAASRIFKAQALTVKELEASFNRTSPKDMRDNALGTLIYISIPGKVVTVFNLIVCAVNWIPRIDACAAFCKRIPAEFEELGLLANIISSFALGYQVGSSIQLGRLWFHPDPKLQQKLKAVVL